MLLSIIIVNWNGQDFLRRCLQSIQLETQEIPYEIIVIDNASTDNSLQLLRDEFPDITLIVNNENVGFAKANNQGIARANGDYIILLNPDTEIRDNALQKLVTYLDNNPRIGIVGPRLTLPNGTIQGGAAGYYPNPVTIFNYALGLHILFPNYFHALWLAPKQYQQTSELDVDWVAGACMVLKSDVLKQIGHLNTNYFMYAEDIELCYRAKKAGWGVRCLSNSSVVHFIGGSVKQRKFQKNNQNIAGLDQFYTQRYSRHVKALMHLEGTFAFGLRALVYWLKVRIQSQPRFQNTALTMRQYAYSSWVYFLNSLGFKLL